MSGTVVPDWTENSAAIGAERRPWRSLWRSRQLVGYLATRDIKLRYRQAVLGVVWVLLQPVISVVIFTLVFSRLAHVDTEGVPYPLFALTGMVMWTYFSSAVSRASAVLVSNPSLVTKVYFPRIAAPAAGLVSPFLDLAVSLLLLAGLLGVYRRSPGLALLAFPLLLVLLALTTFGFALWLSALNVRFRDVQQAVPPLLQVGLFASPVAYSAAALSGWRSLGYAINPMTGLIDLGRWTLVGGPWPGWPLAVSTVTAALILWTGLRYFRRAERSFADVI